MYSCENCDKQFATEKSLKRHSRTIHFNNNKLVCKICSKFLSRRDNLLKHLKTVHKDKVEDDIDKYILSIDEVADVPDLLREAAKSKEFKKRKMDQDDSTPKRIKLLKETIDTMESLQLVIPKISDLSDSSKCFEKLERQNVVLLENQRKVNGNLRLVMEALRDYEAECSKYKIDDLIDI